VLCSVCRTGTRLAGPYSQTNAHILYRRVELARRNAPFLAGSQHAVVDLLNNVQNCQFFRPRLYALSANTAHCRRLLSCSLFIMYCDIHCGDARRLRNRYLHCGDCRRRCLDSTGHTAQAVTFLTIHYRVRLVLPPRLLALTPTPCDWNGQSMPAA